MRNQDDGAVRPVQDEIEIIYPLLTSLEPDLNRQAILKLGVLIGAFHDSKAIRTKGGAQICDLLTRSRDNMRIECFGDALGFLIEARDLANTAKPEALDLGDFATANQNITAAMENVSERRHSGETKIPERLSVEAINVRLKQAKDSLENRNISLQEIRDFIKSAHSRDRDIPGRFYYSVDGLIQKALSVEDPHEAEKLIDRSIGLCRLQKAAR